MTKIISALLLFLFFSNVTARASSSTFLNNPRDLRLTNIRILAERPVGDRTEIEFTTDVQNLDSGRYGNVAIYVATSNSIPSLTIVDALLSFALIAESATVLGAADNVLVISVANIDLATARLQILNGQLLALTADEEIIYTGPAEYVDKPTDDGFISAALSIGVTILTFSNNIPLVQNLGKGDILLADPGPGGYRLKTPMATEMSFPHLAQFIPFEIDSVVVVGDRTQVFGNKRDLNQIIKSGTFIGSTKNAYPSHRDPYNPAVENTYSDEEQEERDILAEVARRADPHDGKLADLAGLNAIPIIFNEVPIGEAIRLSGEILLRSSGLQFEVAFRGFTLKRAVAHIDAGVVAGFVLETTGTNDSLGVAKEVKLVEIPFPPVPINIAGVPMSLGANFTVSIGAEATAPGGISIPIQSGILVGAEIGYENSQTFAAPIKEFIEPRISDPTLFEGMNVTARAWAQVKFEVTIGDSLQLLTAGPSLVVRAEGKFTANPFSNPWWNLDFTGELLGEFNLNLLAWNIAGAETSFFKETFFHRDSGGPLIPAAASPKEKTSKLAAAPAIDLGPKVGRNSRWGVAFQPKPGQATPGNGFVLALQNGDLFTAGSSALTTYLSRFGPDGTLRWCQNFNTIISLVAGVQLPDGRIAITGKSGLNWYLSIYDANGNREFSRVYFTATSIEIRDMAMRINAAGAPEFFVVGFINNTTVTDSDVILSKLDAAGNLLWSKQYWFPEDDEVNGIAVLRDGNIVLAGRTEANVGTDQIMNIPYHGLLMKLSPEGEVIWSQAVASRWGMTFNDVVEAPDGSLFATGFNNDLVTDHYPSILVAKFKADGSLVDHVLIGEDPDSTDQLPNAGDTPYDAANEIIWTEDGLFITGHTGLSTTLAGWVASLTDELGVKWWSSFDGSRADVLQHLAATPDGLAVLGWSDSVMPFGTGGQHSVVLFKYPWEGMVRLHPDTGAQMRYLAPRVFLSSANEHFIAVDNTNPLQPQYPLTAPISFVSSNLTVTVSAATVPIGLVVTPTLARLERIEPSVVNSFEEWAAYHQLSAASSALSADSDGDLRSNAEEFFYGTNPHVADTTPPPSITLEQNGDTLTATIKFRYASWATFPSSLMGGSDLNEPLAPLTGFSVADTGFDPGPLDGKFGPQTERSIQQQIQSENQKFFFKVGLQLP